MRSVLLLAAIFLTGCAAPKVDWDYTLSSAARFNDTNFTRTLTCLIGRIEHGDLSAWPAFASYAPVVDGEHSETYSVACAELTRRDPTFYLRRFLLGDHTSIACARRAYDNAGPNDRKLLDAIYANRLYIADKAEEARKIRKFISETTTRKAP